MLKTFYIQTNEINKITDIIEYPYEDYVEVQLNTPLPSGVLGGAYKLINDSVVYVPEWDIQVKDLEDKISTLEKQNKELENALVELASLI